MKFLRACSVALLFGVLALSAGCGGDEEIAPEDEQNLEQAAPQYESAENPAAQAAHGGGQQPGGR